ncbi:unnamed protein product [Cuscuta europaea]|uniref:Uncharacterized protein n=1 Tax=Cuscuta europaea TaxID=41803 RepID=A0A9P0ZRM3_CUSEU|nr:unnamed protein product [Cuscuta europaea]
MPEKTECREQDKKGGKMKVQLNLGKSGGFFMLLGGLLVTVLLSSAFRKRSKPTGKADGGDENGPEKSTAAEEQNGMEDDGERINGDGEEPARQGIQFILSSPASLLNDEIRIKDRDSPITVQACGEEQDDIASGCDDQEIFTNNSSIPATSCEQENSSQSFGNHHHVLKEVSLDSSSEEGTLSSGDSINIIKTDSFPAKQEEMEILRGDSDQKNTSFEQLGDFQVNENTNLVSIMNVPSDITTSQVDMNLEDDTSISTMRKTPTVIVNLTEKGSEKEKVLSSVMPSNEKEGEEIVDDHKRDDGDVYNDDGVSDQMGRNLEDNTLVSTVQKKPATLVLPREVQEDIVDNDKAKVYSSVMPSNEKEGEEIVDDHKCDDGHGDVYNDDGVTNQMEINVEDNTQISTVQKKPTMLVNLRQVQEDIVDNVKEEVRSSVIPSNDKEGEEIVDEHEQDDGGVNDNGDEDVVDDDNHGDDNNDSVVDGYGDRGVHNGVFNEMEIDIEEDVLNDYDDDDDYNDRDGSEDISDESNDGVGMEAIWPELPEVEDSLMGLDKGPYINEEIEDDGSITAESYITVCRRDMKMNITLDRLVTYSFLSKRRIVAGTIAWLIVYSCICAIALIFVLPNFLNA